jgi:hypothetical protein
MEIKRFVQKFGKRGAHVTLPISLLGKEVVVSETNSSEKVKNCVSPVVKRAEPSAQEEPKEALQVIVPKEPVKGVVLLKDQKVVPETDEEQSFVDSYN